MNIFRFGAIFVGAVAFLLIAGLGADAVEVVHYKSFRHAGDQVINVDHFETGNLILSCEISPNWACFEGSDDLAVSFVNRELQACSIQVQFSPLSSMPEDEKAARELYRSELEKLPPPNVDKGARVPAFKDLATFPLMYTLAASKDVHPNRMVTFFIRKPFLFRVTIDFPEKLIAQPRVDYEAMVASITVEDKGLPPAPAEKNGEKDTSLNPNIGSK